MPPAPCPSPAVSSPSFPLSPPAPRSGAHGATTRPLDPLALSRFMAIYARALEALVVQPSLGYAYGREAVPAVVARMRAALVAGTYALDGLALRGTCRALGIRPTRRAIEAYLAGPDARTAR